MTSGSSAPVRMAALLSMPRTGSTMLTTRLSRHRQVRFFSALFSEAGWNPRSDIIALLRDTLGPDCDSLTYRIAHQTTVLEALSALVGTDKVIGIKHHLSGDPLVTQRLLDDRAVAKIVLRRPNLLASYSSELLVHAGRSAMGAPPPSSVRFEAEGFERFRAWRHGIDRRWDGRIAACAGPVMTIAYGEARRDEGVARLLNFIGVDPVVPDATKKKRNSDAVLARFVNPDDALAYLRANALEDWASESEAVIP